MHQPLNPCTKQGINPLPRIQGMPAKPEFASDRLYGTGIDFYAKNKHEFNIGS